MGNLRLAHYNEAIKGCGSIEFNSEMKDDEALKRKDNIVA